VLRPDRGSVLALVPAGFLVLMLLSALAVDSAVAYLGQQQLHDSLSAAANDSVGAAVSNRAFYSGGSLALDPASAAQVVCSSIRAQAGTGLHDLRVAMAISGVSIRVSGSAVVYAVFGRALPGFGRRSVRSSAAATLAAGPGMPAGPASFGPPTLLQC
jgi:hypothetical protein